MSIESSHDNGPEQSTADKAGEMLRRLEKGEPVQLWNTMSKLGDDPSFVGRINFITRNKDFVAAFNKNKPEGMPPLDTRKDAYGYKGTPDQNAVFVKTYLEMKAKGTAVEAPAPKEHTDTTQDVDPKAPKDGEGDLDDWLGFMPRGSEKQAVNTSLPIDVDLSKKEPGDRPDALLRTVFEDLSDFKYLVESHPMALATAVTTVNEGLRALGKSPYTTLAETASAEVQQGDLVLHQKDNSTLRVALFPDSAWNRVDIRNAEQTPQERQKAIAEMTRPKDVIDADFFKDDEEFLFNGEAPASIAANTGSTEEKKAS